MLFSLKRYSSFLALSVICGIAYGGQYQGQGHDGGHNDHYEENKYPYQPYGFGYDIEDGYGNKQWRHEKSHQPWHVTGSYGYKDKHGIMREVDYVADKNGFRAHIRTNEPGTAPKDPAAVKLDSQPVSVDNGGGHGGGQSYDGNGGGQSYGGNGGGQSYGGQGGEHGGGQSYGGGHGGQGGGYGGGGNGYDQGYASTKLKPKYIIRKRIF